MWWFCRRHRQLELERKAQQAQHELEVSRERLQTTREQVIRPLQERAMENRFAELIRASLREGYKKN